MEIFVHINKRLKSRPNVQLPIDDLIQKFNESAAANLSFVTVKTNFIIFKSLHRVKSSQFIEFQLDLYQISFS